MVGDCRTLLATLKNESVQCVVTSPPYYGLRDYGTGVWEGGDPDCEHRSPTMREGRNEDRATLAGSAATNGAQLVLAHHSACGKCGAIKRDQQIGLERTPEEYVDTMVEVFRDVRRILKKDGTLWLNLGDSYATDAKGARGTEKSTLSKGDELAQSRVREASVGRRLDEQPLPKREARPVSGERADSGSRGHHTRPLG